MGNCLSFEPPTSSLYPPPSPQDEKRSQTVEDELKRARREAAITTKALLLGAGESGKSTIVKQMRLSYASQYTPDELAQYTEIVFSNTLTSAQAILAALPSLGLSPSPSSPLASITPFLLSLTTDELTFYSSSSTGDGEGEEQVMLRKDVADALRVFWEAEETKRAVEPGDRGRFQLNDSAQYFFDSLPRLSSASYTPTTDDVLRCRIVTTGIFENSFSLQGGAKKLVVVDVGGQRSERKKWIHCFENVNVLIFVVAISEYDQTLYEDQTANRLNESALLYESIAASRWFAKAAFVLFLNKVDLFTEKILSPSPRSRLALYHPDFTGPPQDLSAAKGYMRKRFEELDKRRGGGGSTLGRGGGGAAGVGGGRQSYTHFTCATDTAATKVVLAALLTSVLTTRLESSGLL